MTHPDQILSEFIDAWNAGRRPDVDEYLNRAPDEQQAELAEEITTFLAFAPTPAYDPVTLSALRAEPAVVATTQSLAGELSQWPALLPRLRERAGLSLADLARRVCGALGLTGREEKTERYLADMERDALDPGGVSRRVLDALARALGTDASDLGSAGDAGGWAARPAPALLRGEAEDLQISDLET
ncbi:MAG: helix-turn-helix transcriptional regulator, partial [Solirubrobacterales bacterium]|nr:helix-turn-helix transcriptional regulator [Solirubrobacterales bacterium]